MKHLLIIVTAVLCCCTSCLKEEDGLTSPSDYHPFSGSIENIVNTKTTLDENNNVRWSADDRLIIFKGTNLGSIYKVADDDIGATSASFEYVSAISEGFVAGSTIENNIAFYPMNKNIKCARADDHEPARSYELTGVTLPEIQNYQPVSFGQGTFPMIALTESTDDYELIFRNVCGGIKLQLLGDCSIKEIAITGNMQEALAGTARITGYVNGDAPEIEITENAVTTLKLNCGSEGVQLNTEKATVFIIALPPMEFTNGFTVVATDTEGRMMTLKTSQANSILRSSLLKMPEITIDETNTVSLSVDDSDKIIPYKAGTFDIEVTGNVNYEIIVPEVDWLTKVDSKALNTDICTFAVTENNSEESRSCEIMIKSLVHSQNYTIKIIQAERAELIEFADDMMKQNCVSAFDTNKDGELSYEEAEAVTDLRLMTLTNKTFKSFDEFRSFTSVTEIPEEFFKNCISLESIILPESLTHISNEAFESCVNLSHINIPSNVNRIGGAFYNCKKLQKVHIQSLVKYLLIDFYFYRSAGIPTCNSANLYLNEEPITEITSFPNEISHIQSYAFYYCQSLETLEISDNIEEIEEAAFMGCTNLRKVIISDNVKTIRKSAFEDCINLTEVTLPSSLSELTTWMFKDCSSLVEITIPKSVTIISSGAFDGCNNLKRITLSSSIPPIINAYGYDLINDLKFYVPNEYIEAYKTAEGWSDYTDRIIGY